MAAGLTLMLGALMAFLARVELLLLMPPGWRSGVMMRWLLLKRVRFTFSYDWLASFRNGCGCWFD